MGSSQSTTVPAPALITGPIGNCTPPGANLCTLLISTSMTLCDQPGPPADPQTWYVSNSRGFITADSSCHNITTSVIAEKDPSGWHLNMTTRDGDIEFWAGTIDTGDTKGIKFHYEGQNGDDQMVEQDSCKKTTHGVDPPTDVYQCNYKCNKG